MNSEEMKSKAINNRSLGEGIVIVILLALFGWIIVYLISKNAGISLAAAVFVALAIGKGGIWTIPIGHKAVIKRLKKPLEKIHLDHGLAWLFPWIYEIEIKDCRKQFVEIPEFTAKCKDDASIEIRVRIEFAVVDAYKYLFLAGNIEERLRDLVEDTTRERIRRHILKTALNARDKFAQVIIERAEKVTEEEDWGILEHWGIKIISVFIPKLMPTKDLEEIMNKKRKEQDEREAEKIEIEATIDHMNLLKGQLTDLPLDERTRKALEAIQLQQGKIKKDVKEIDISGIKELIGAFLEKSQSRGDKK